MLPKSRILSQVSGFLVVRFANYNMQMLGFFFNMAPLSTIHLQTILGFLPERASEQGNVIGSVHIYIYVYKKIVIERTRDLIYLKFVATDFFPKIIGPTAGENSGDSV